MGELRVRLTALIVVGLLATVPASGGIDELGRNDVRVYSGAVEIRAGQSVTALSLAERLERRGYRRVHRRPRRAGEFFWGHEVFWVYTRPAEADRTTGEARLVGLDLRSGDGGVVGLRGGEALSPDQVVLTLEPTVLAEDLEGRRAARIPVRFSELPERVWRTLLAAEDARFFDHQGVDGRAIARALLANLRAGEVAQGGSTITQQLIKMRDLTPARSVGRKVSEALRALALEADYDKQDILEEYLNHVYLGHIEGVALHGYGAAAEAFFGRPAARLTWGEAALLAAVVQSPNRYSPVRNPGAVEERYHWILDRLEELGWATSAELSRARTGLPATRARRPARPLSRTTLSALSSDLERVAPRHAEQGRGAVMHTTLDPWLQQVAERVVDAHLETVRRRARGGVAIQAALVAVRASSGDVVAYVGGGSDGGSLDRVGRALRQPGSTLKPLVLAEAFADCGDRDPLYPAARVSNRQWSIDLASGRWTPQNPDGSAHGEVTLRQASVRSLNLPFVRVGAWCGWDAVASRMRRAGIELPPDPPPAFVLGAVELTPLQLAGAYTSLIGDGRRTRPRLWGAMRRPGGRLIAQQHRQADRVVPPEVAFLVRDILRQAVAEGTGRAAVVGGAAVLAKTGTSSEGRDAWVAGGFGDLVVVAWCGRDDGAALGLSGGEAAAPLFRAFMRRAAATQSADDPVPPEVEVRSYDPRTGVLVRPGRRGAAMDYFIRGDLPPKRRWWRPGREVPVVN